MSPSIQGACSLSTPTPTHRPTESRETKHLKDKLRRYLQRILDKVISGGSKPKAAEQDPVGPLIPVVSKVTLPVISKFEEHEEEHKRKTEEIWWGGVRSIKDQELISLALYYLGDSHGWTCSVLDRLDGSYNRAHIIQFEGGEKVVIRIPACGTPDRWTEEDAFALRSQALTMKFIRRHTNLPIPDVLQWSNTCDNEDGFGHPYIITSFMPGQEVTKAWGDEGNYGPSLIHKRENILRSLAQTMAEFQKLPSFNASGSLYFEHDLDNDPKVGPRYTVDESEYPARRPYYRQTYNNTRLYLRGRLANWWKETKADFEEDPVSLSKTRGIFKILAMAIDAVPGCEPFEIDNHDWSALLAGEAATSEDRGANFDATTEPELTVLQQSVTETFVLAPPDFDSQNVLVDEEGNITGLLDWDEVYTVPRFAGFAALPMWITRDYYRGYEWDGEIGNSDRDLAQYRALYSGFMRDALEGKSDDYKFTATSHLLQALQYACEKENNMSWSGVKNLLSPILSRTNLDFYVVRIGDVELGFKPGEERWLRDQMAQLLRCTSGSKGGIHI